MNGTLLPFLAGALALAQTLAGVYFIRFWRKTRNSLFLSFACAFWLLAINRVIISCLGDEDERAGHSYVLRVIGFLLILGSIIHQNIVASRRPE
jgi:hypothetical protein